MDQGTVSDPARESVGSLGTVHMFVGGMVTGIKGWGSPRRQFQDTYQAACTDPALLGEIPTPSQSPVALNLGWDPRNVFLAIAGGPRVSQGHGHRLSLCLRDSRTQAALRSCAFSRFFAH